jgi:hypothetical protein
MTIDHQVAKHQRAVADSSSINDAVFADEVGGSSSLTTKNERGGTNDGAAASMINGPETQPACAAARVTHTARASTGKTSAAAAPALSSQDPATHAPLSTQPSAPLSCRTRAHRQARWPVDGTRSPRSRT